MYLSTAIDVAETPVTRNMSESLGSLIHIDVVPLKFGGRGLSWVEMGAWGKTSLNLKGLFGYMLLLHLSEVDKQSILDNKW